MLHAAAGSPAAPGSSASPTGAASLDRVQAVVWLAERVRETVDYVTDSEVPSRQALSAPVDPYPDVFPGKIRQSGAPPVIQRHRNSTKLRTPELSCALRTVCDDQ